MTRLLWVRCVLAASTLVALGCGPAVPRRGEIAFSAKSFVLRDLRYPSGLRVLGEEDRSRPVASVVAIVDMGASDDPPGQEGLAHLIEHLTFRSRPDGKVTVAQIQEYLGASGNAMTSFDETAYIMTAPNTMLPELLRVEAARLEEPLANVEQAVFDVEREVVRNELRLRSETGIFGSVLAELQERLFPPSHPYARTVSGSHGSLSALTLDGARGATSKYYRPENVTLVVSGDYDLAELDGLLRKAMPASWFEPVKGERARGVRARVSAKPPEVPDPPPASGIGVVQAGVTVPQVWIAWSLPRQFDSDGFLNTLVSTMVRGRMSVARQGVEEIEGAGAILLPGAQASILACRVGIKLDDQAEAERIATAVLDEMFLTWDPSGGTIPRWEPSSSHAAADAIMSRLRMTSAVELTLDSEQRFGRLLGRATSLHFTGDISMYGRMLDAVASVDSGRLANVAYKYITRDRARVVYVSPHEDDTAAALPGGTSATASEPMPPGLSRTAEDAALAALKPGFLDYMTFTLTNGVKVVIGRRAAFPVVTAGVLLRGGLKHGQRGAADLAMRFASSDNGKHGHLYFDFGGRMTLRANDDSLSVVGQVASGNVGNLLGILSEHVSSQKLDQSDYLQTRKRVFSRESKQDALPHASAERAFEKALFGDHQYGATVDFGDWSTLDSDVARSWLADIYRPDNAVLVVVGDVDLDKTEKLAKHHFESWSSSDGTTPVAPPAVATRTSLSPQAIVTNKPGATQAELRIGCILPPAKAENLALYDLLATVLEHELKTELRTEHGTSYGVGVEAKVLLGGTSVLNVETTLENARLALALGLLKKTWSSLADEIDLDAVDWARWSLTSRYNYSFDTSLAAVLSLLEGQKLGWPLKWMDEYPGHLKNASAAQVQAAFRACRGSTVLSLVGDAALIRRAVSEAWH